MPGVVMDNVNIEGSVRRPGLNEARNGAPNTFDHPDKYDLLSGMNGSFYVNGTSSGIAASTAESVPTSPFKLPHITQGFFPFGTLVNRSVQECWNELSELITELATIQVPALGGSMLNNGKSAGNQSSENVHKKLRLLDFAHSKRAEFIKLLVLSQWSRQAADVSKLIDIQGFIRTRHQSYDAALQYVGEVKRDLVRAQVANPDLKTAVEVLSKGRVASLPDLGYKPHRPLTARVTLKKLLKLNRIISVRLALHDSVPPPLRNYRVHDGRVTFTISNEFELDLSVAEESKTSQFFFVDIRFLFSPSSPIPKGRIFNELDGKINDLLRDDGLVGCFQFLHGLVLTNKINILFKQAVDLSRGLWADALHIELLHRTLVVQYWPQRSGPKSWLEIGVKSGHRGGSSSDPKPGISHLGFRWMRDGQQVSSDAIRFNPDDLSMELILRSVIALHASHLLSTAFTTLKKHVLFSNHTLSIQAQLSPTEPGDCLLDVQLTASRSIRVSIEPMSGSITLWGTPHVLERPDGDRGLYKSSIEEILSRVARLRCINAVDEIEFGTKALGLEPVNQRVLGLDPRKLFPPGVMRTAFFTHRLWNRHWVAAATSSMDGDHWWLVELRPTEAAKTVSSYSIGDHCMGVPQAHVVSETLVPPQRRLDYTTCAELVHGLTGILAIHANARYLADLPTMHFWPSLKELHLGTDFTVSDLLFNYSSTALPPAFRVALPFGIKKQSQFKEMIRLVFHGIDSQSRSVIMMAHGALKTRVKSLVPLVSNMDSSLIIEDKGAGFALRLLVPAGHSVVACLFELLQRLEGVLSILQSLIWKGMEPKSLSLSRIDFAYGPENKFSAFFDISAEGPSLSDYVDIADAVSKTKPLFQLKLGIKFKSSSPHRRIQEPLTVALNQRFTEAGVESTLQLLATTLPLLRSLDQITAQSNQTDLSIVQIIARKSTVYLIHYPQLKSRFHLSAVMHQDRLVWMLRDANGMDQSGRGQIAAFIQEKLYQSKGDGWNGLGDGAVASINKVGNLILELHECLNAPHLQLDREVEAKPEQIPNQLHIKGSTSVAPQAMGNTDVITID
ncbi:RNA polymerase II holoenzyme/mediator complex component Rgr1, putative [Penicillium digitatum]|uniref:Mediator of RNA polymerase II transcription subunit 14 n=3 Tax=Penicillium digitatum TaxID=36651 RepID=K9FRZ3_PEND2|nr:RNA polymerase II holoenzyme/mediator complex component Rgr1, putative [Penicillium digitatum Pd1]EKV11159.1 RNA polymerase II holoenzyme/mediator complex component Rgr1, putative [Penicillium digitatum Pd1]EKV11909.1 RNA polymerase II holoenzyme/mediator complex component Rgr1, putative [Penicillium digitatum PHI26]QQK43863.1 RNA polymerase II holoenzyme/mediator complex component Rgr1, putative [Penicillium digitatum]